MPNSTHLFAVRLIGFSAHEKAIVETIFTNYAGQRYRYFCLPEDNLRDPDVFLGNADEEKALIALSYLEPSDLHPALLIASNPLTFPYLTLLRPVQPQNLVHALDALIETQANVLSKGNISDVAAVPERRRSDRLTAELLSPADYIAMRRARTDGGVIVVDENNKVTGQMAELLTSCRISVDHAASESDALDLCKRHETSVVIIDTSTPNADPYRLSQAIKKQVTNRVSIVFLNEPSFIYDQRRAHAAGCDGYLDKPVSIDQLLSLIRKFHPVFWR